MNMPEPGPRDWPHDSSYVNRCYQCSENYYGPKRSGICWTCAPEGTRIWWEGIHKTGAVAVPIPTPPKPARVIAGRTLKEWEEFARRDDCLERMVPSDLRQLIGLIPKDAT